MIYKCLKCGHIFEDGEQSSWNESRGEFWGTPCSQEESGCPICNGDYAETIPCKICGSRHLENELISEVCEECINERKHDVNICYLIGKMDTEKVKLNSFLTAIFSVSEIEDILWQEIIKNADSIDCSDFINKDRYWFAERLAEEVNK